jgi:3-oxoacyl-[acyl-carrier protein] reductase
VRARKGKPAPAPAISGGAAKARRVALVTGSAKRLGRAMAMRLAGLGYHTWVHYLNSRKEAAETLDAIRAAGGSGSLIRGDMASRSDVRAMAEKLRKESGRLDALINNVGVYSTGGILEYPVEEFERTLQANLTGCFHLIQECLPLFSEGSGIVNIGYAGLENLTASTHNTAYLISKSGLFILTKSLALALGPRGVRVNMVSPGILENSVELPRRPKDHIPLGRLGALDDVCDAVQFLLGKQAGYVTGVNLDVAGGYMLKLRGLEGPGGG